MNKGRMQSGRNRAGRLIAAGLTLASLALLLPATSLCAQQGRGQNFPPTQMSDPMGGPTIGDPVNAQMEAKRLNALNAERQKSMVAETNKLLKLTAELNDQINGTHPASLSEAQLRMVAEIEKLAHSIREKMSTSVKSNPQLGPAMPMMLPPSPLR